MTDEHKEILKEEYEKVSSEVEGKTQEELEEMQTKAEETIHAQHIEVASEYLYNLMKLGKSYSDEEFIKVLDQHKEENSTPEKRIEFGEKTYNKFDLDEVKLSMTIMKLGYNEFGKFFVENLIKDDPDSAKRVFEILIQQYNDLVMTINTIRDNAETMMAEKVKEEKEKKENK